VVDAHFEALMAMSISHAVLLAVALVVLGTTIIAMGIFSTNDKFPVEGRTVIVTGGSQGLGLEFAKQLAAKGANVVIVARNKSKLQKALAEIKTRTKSPRQRFESLSYDLESPESAPEILDTVTQWNNGEPPEVILNCAGFCIPGFFASTDVKSLRAQMDTIYWSCAYMAHAALNKWLDPKHSTNTKKTHHVIFTCSTLAFFPLAGYAPYSPAKAAMRSLADTLTQEVAVYNGANRNSEVKIHTVFPMGILTPGFENENKTKSALTLQLEKDDKPQTAEEVARIAIARLEAGDGMITTMLVGHLMRGWGMAGSVRNGLVDVFWNFVGSIVIMFVVPDFMSKCRAWGHENGLEGAR
jgi:3-dehydrosphinganine reductase